MAGRDDALERVRQSCEQAVNGGFLKSVHIDKDNLVAFYERHVAPRTEKLTGGSGTVNRLAIPLKFSSLDEEINFYVLYGFMQFGSGWRPLLHQYCNRGAADTILYGLMSMVISGRAIDARGLAALTLQDISELFNIPIKVEKAFSPSGDGNDSGNSGGGGAITQMVDSELRPFAEQLLKALNMAGQELWARQCTGFADFVRQSIADAKQKKLPVVQALVDDLVETFPFSLDDKATLKHPDTKEEIVVYLYKKAQLIVATLYNNLHDKEPEVFAFSPQELSRLTVFVDNVIPAVLIKDGVLQIEDELHRHIQVEKKVLPVGQQETELRVAALYAIEMLSDMSKDRCITPMQLDYLLWSTLGKKPEYRRFERHYTRDTLFY